GPAGRDRPSTTSPRPRSTPNSPALIRDRNSAIAPSARALSLLCTSAASHHSGFTVFQLNPLAHPHPAAPVTPIDARTSTHAAPTTPPLPRRRPRRNARPPSSPHPHSGQRPTPLSPRPPPALPPTS